MASYITTIDARDYALQQGLALPELDVDDATLGLQTYLNRASTYLDRLYGAKYLGTRLAGAGLYWPRTLPNYYDSTGNYRDDFTSTSIPAELGWAVVELTSKMFSDDFDPFKQPDAALLEESKSLDSLSISKKFAEPYKVNPFYTLDLLLLPLLKGNVSKKITMTRGA